MSKHVIRLVLFWSVAVTTLAPSAATANSTWRVEHAPVMFGGPTLLGDQVAWIAPRRDPGGDLYLASRGQPPRRLQTFPAELKPYPGNTLEYVFQLEGSASSLALLRERICIGLDPCSERLDTFTGAANTRLKRIERCDWSSLPGISVSGWFTAIPSCDFRLIVRDMRGGQPDTVLENYARDLQIAGRYVAWVEYGPGHEGDIVVFDRLASVVSYVIKHGKLGRSVQGLALQADGKIAFGVDPNPNDAHPRTVIGWASPKAPHLHPLGLHPRVYYFLRMARNRIAFGRIGESQTPNHAEIGIVGLRGAMEIVTHHAPDPSNMDFDGNVIAYAVHSDRHMEIRTRDVR